MTTRAGWFTLWGIVLEVVGLLLIGSADAYGPQMIAYGIGLTTAGAPFFLAGLIGQCVEDSLKRWRYTPPAPPAVEPTEAAADEALRRLYSR